MGDPYAQDRLELTNAKHLQQSLMRIIPQEECESDKSAVDMDIGRRPDSTIICARRGIFDQDLFLQGIQEEAQGAACKELLDLLFF